VPELGRRAEAICEDAAKTAGPRDAEWVVRTLDAALRLVYEKQLRVLRDVAIQDFRRATPYASADGASGASADEHERLGRTERAFCVAAVESSRPSWSYEAARRELRESLFAVAARGSEVRAATLKAAQQRANYFTVLRKLVLELEDATKKRLGLDSPVDAAVAWRVPDTNINLSAALQRAKTNVQLSVVPDDSAPLLSTTGFNKPRVAAGDLAMSYRTDFNYEAAK